MQERGSCRCGAFFCRCELVLREQLTQLLKLDHQIQCFEYEVSRDVIA